MFKIRLYLILFSAVALLSCHEPNVQEVLSETENQTSNISSITYEADYYIKFFSNEDTIHLHGEVQLLNVPDDTLLGYHVWVKRDEVEHIYRGDQLFVIDHKNKKVIMNEDPTSLGVSYITGNIVHGIIWDDLFGIDTSDVLSMKLMENKTGNDHYLIEFIHPDDFTKNAWERYWIGKGSYLPSQWEFYCELDNEFQYNRINLDIKSINEELDIDDVQIPEDYDLEFQKPRNPEDYKLLDSGLTAPEIVALDVDSNQTDLSTIDAKLILLDFWYLSCYPCRQAIPFLVELQEKYRNDGLVVIGINSFDVDRMDKLKEFMELKNMNYPTLLTKRSVDSVYNVKGYPTMYALNEEGIIVYGNIGYGEPTDSTVEAMVRRELDLD